MSLLRRPYPIPRAIWGEGPLVDLTMSANWKALGTRPHETRGAHGERPPEFKARAIDLCRFSEGLTIADVAPELGIGTKTFRKGVG
jgi:hypothetical protein